MRETAMFRDLLLTAGINHTDIWGDDDIWRTRIHGRQMLYIRANAGPQKISPMPAMLPPGGTAGEADSSHQTALAVFAEFVKPNQ